MDNFNDTTLSNLADSRRQIGTRVVAALATGCLAVSLCPAIALAAPADQAGPQQGGQSAQMQQGPGGQMPGGNGQADFGQMPGVQPNGQTPDGQPSGQMPDGQAPQGQAPDGQAPDGQAPQGQAPDGQAPQGQAPDGQMPDGQAPDGQAPDGQAPQGQMPNGQAPQGRDDVLDSKIKEILAAQFGIDMTLDQIERGNNTQPVNADKSPVDLPEGEVNVQQVIDSIRDLLRTYSVDDLQSADFTDSDFVNKLTEQVAKDNEERLALFASGEKPDQAQAPEQGKDQQVGKALEKSGFAPEKATMVDDDAEKAASANGASSQNADESLLTRLINLITGVFGQKA